jgi:hypothetical protein
MAGSGLMNETNLMHSIMLANHGCRLFRNNVGTAWTGSPLIKQPDGSVTLRNARPLHAGLCKGSSDLIGFKPVTITPEMVGRTVAVFTAIEVKTPKGKPTPEQLHFLKRVKELGGIAGIARSVDDVLAITDPSF